MNLKLKRTPAIYLVGFMGSGKTSVGRLLAERLGWQFADLDDEIEAREGITISEIFEQRGEADFRRVEAEILKAHVRAVEGGRPLVLALGGGAFVPRANAELVIDHGVPIWLDCPLDTVKRRVEQATHRPLARDQERFARLYEERREAYARADYRIPIESDDPEPAVAAILALPIFK